MDSVGEGRVLNERRQKIYDALIRYNPDVAGSYKAAIRALATSPSAGEERARVSNIGNLMREVIITLPSIIGSTSEGGPKEVDTNSLVRDLPGKLALFSDFNLNQDQEYIPIPKGVAEIFAEIVRGASQDAKSIRENAAALLAEGTPDNHPAIKQWVEANQFFTKCTHLEIGRAHV